MKKVWWLSIAAAVTLLAASPAMAALDDDAVAQFGKVRKFVNKVQKETPQTEKVQNNSSNENVQKSAPAAPVSGDAAKALEKINDESKREAPAVWALNYGADRGGGSSSESEAFKNQSGYLLNIHRRTLDEVKEFKAQLEARNNENLAIIAALTGADGKPIPAAREGAGYDKVKDEIERYENFMSSACNDVKRFAKLEQTGNQVKINQLQVGMHYVTTKNGKEVFVRNVDGQQLISPPDQEMFNNERARYRNLASFIRKEPPAEQYPEYSTAQLANQFIFIANKNSTASETKVAIPASKMNNPELNARMLKLAKEAYPKWGIVKLVIVESDWRIEKNGLGQILHRRINTKIIMPKSSGGGYIMRTLSFIEPYAGGGKYGAAKPFGLGTDEAAVDYKK